MPGSHSYGGRWGWGSGLGPPCSVGKGSTGSKKLTQDAMQHECNEMLFVSEQYRLSKRYAALEPNPISYVNIHSVRSLYTTYSYYTSTGHSNRKNRQKHRQNILTHRDTCTVDRVQGQNFNVFYTPTPTHAHRHYQPRGGSRAGMHPTIPD